MFCPIHQWPGAVRDKTFSGSSKIKSLSCIYVGKAWKNYAIGHFRMQFDCFQSSTHLWTIKEYAACRKRIVFSEKTRGQYIFTIKLMNTSPRLQENEAQTAEQHARESIRIARTTRELLKKFAAAYHLMLGSTDVWGWREDWILFVYILYIYIYKSYMHSIYFEKWLIVLPTSI